MAGSNERLAVADLQSPDEEHYSARTLGMIVLAYVVAIATFGLATLFKV
jgi:hypothetical protein